MQTCPQRSMPGHRNATHLSNAFVKLLTSFSTVSSMKPLIFIHLFGHCWALEQRSSFSCHKITQFLGGYKPIQKPSAYRVAWQRLRVALPPFSHAPLSCGACAHISLCPSLVPHRPAYSPPTYTGLPILYGIISFATRALSCVCTELSSAA